MNGYLVMIRCTMDDVPLRLFDSRKKATRFAYRLRNDPSLLPAEMKKASDLLGYDLTGSLLVAVVRFLKGQVTSTDIVHQFEG